MNIQVRKSKSGKSKYVLKFNGKKYRCDTLMQMSLITDLHFTTLQHMLKRPPKTPKYNLSLECYTLQEIADVTGKSIGYLDKILRGKKKPDNIKINKINNN